MAAPAPVSAGLAPMPAVVSESPSYPSHAPLSAPKLDGVRRELPVDPRQQTTASGPLAPPERSKLGAVLLGVGIGVLLYGLAVAILLVVAK